MHKSKLILLLSLLSVSTLGSTQAFAKNIEVRIGKIAEGKEIIIPNNFDDEENLDHKYFCSDTHPVFIRTKGSKIQPACLGYGSLDSQVTPIGEAITFITPFVEYKDAVLDVEKKKIR